jgi:hypothetical protein
MHVLEIDCGVNAAAERRYCRLTCNWLPESVTSACGLIEPSQPTEVDHFAAADR